MRKMKRIFLNKVWKLETNREMLSNLKKEKCKTGEKQKKP